MAQRASRDLEVGIVASSRREEALRLLYSGHGESGGPEAAIATLEAAERGELSLEGLFAARRGRRLVGVIWGRVGSGRSALVWPPRLVPREPEATVQRLLDRLGDYLRAEGVGMAQAMLEVEAKQDCDRLLAHGFLHAADLHYLVCFSEQFPESRPSSELEFEPYGAEHGRRLAELIERTYSGTRDLPLLNGLRPIDDVVSGYRETGVFSPNRWLFARHGGRDIGCLLLTDHPAEDQWELVYMGLVSEARGRGWGLQMTRHGQWLAGRSGRQRMVLAADAANGPALSVYEAAGFVVWNRRRVLLKFFDEAPNRSAGDQRAAP